METPGEQQGAGGGHVGAAQHWGWVLAALWGWRGVEEGKHALSVVHDKPPTMASSIPRGAMDGDCRQLCPWVAVSTGGFSKPISNPR